MLRLAIAIFLLCHSILGAREPDWDELTLLANQPDRLQIVVKEVTDKKTLPLRTYEFHVSNLDEGTQCNCFLHPLTPVKFQRFECQVGPQGHLYHGPSDPFAFHLYGFLPGSDVEIYLTNSKITRCGKLTVTQRPIEVTSQDGYTLKMSVRNLGAVWLIEGTGFDPCEEVKADCYFDTLSFQHMLTADEQGTVFSTVFPKNGERVGGKCRFAATGKKGTVEINCPWGMQFIEAYNSLAASDKERFDPLLETKNGILTLRNEIPPVSKRRSTILTSPR